MHRNVDKDVSEIEKNITEIDAREENNVSESYWGKKTVKFGNNDKLIGLFAEVPRTCILIKIWLCQVRF